jgi:FAD/FMN-containing dehydrogenase
MEENTRSQFERELREGVKGEVSFRKYTLGVYATDASIYQLMPLAVVLPVSVRDIAHTIRTARRFNVSIVPRGAGTSLGGQAIGHSLIIDFTKYMNRILEVNVKERWVKVQPGVVLDELNAFLRPYHLHFAPDPATGNRATIGGMIGNNSSGSRSVTYGIMQDHVLETKMILSDGSVFHFGAVHIENHIRELKKTNDK